MNHLDSGGDVDSIPNVSQIYLLTFNPRLWAWDDYEEFLDQVRRNRMFEGQWSTGSRTRDIGPGDRVYLLRQGSEPRGIIASGEVASEAYQEENWRDDGSRWLANYVDVDWKEAVPLDDPLPLATLRAAAPDVQKKVWEPQSGGTRLAPDHAAITARLWSEHVGKRA